MEQKMIVVATMCLHNFILENLALDKDFIDVIEIQIMCLPYPEGLGDKFLLKMCQIHLPDMPMTGLHRFLDDLARAITLSRV
jgi:hypothetical protein